MQKRWQLLYQVPRRRYLEVPAAKGLVPLPFAILIAVIAVAAIVGAVFLLADSIG